MIYRLHQHFDVICKGDPASLIQKKQNLYSPLPLKAVIKENMYRI